MSAVDSKLTQERLKELLHYDPENGRFTWARVTYAKDYLLGAEAGCRRSDGYILIRVDGRLHRAHRLAWLYVHGEWPTGDVDHVNGKPSDNRLANLRDVSHRTNLQNMRRPHKDGSTGYLGVSFSKQHQQYAARIRIGGAYRHLGLFSTAEGASEAYLSAKRRHHEGCTI